MPRIRLLKICFLAAALVIVGRAVQLQLAADPRLERLARRQFSSKITAMPRRGVIFDRNGEGLAISLKVRSLFFRPELMKKEMTASERTRVLFNLERVLHIPLRKLNAKAHSDRGFVWIKRQLSETEERKIRELGVLDFGDAIGLAEETKRFYPNRELGAHVLGSVGVDGQGLEGLELLYENILNAQKVRIASNKDARGRRIFRDNKGLLAFKDGQSLVLTIDKAIQYEAEKALSQAIREHEARAGTVIVAEVDSGEILALANYPTYNPNNPRKAAQANRRNRAITDAFEPGSTFKPLLIAHLLEKGHSPNTKVYCEQGSFKVEDRRISEAEAHEKFEWLTYGEVVKHSSNIGAAKLALQLGANGMTQLVDRLSIGERTGIDLPGEASGWVSTKSFNSQVRLANVGFGHGFTVTPLQMLTYYLAIANGGHWIQPKLVKAVLSEDPDSLERGAIRYRLGHRFDSPKTKKIFSSKTATQLTAMLETVTQEGGTATTAQLEEWPVAGKTGTAQKIDPKTRRYSRTKFMSTFVGFAPSNKPKLVALVTLDEPKNGYYATTTAAPVFREVMKASLLRERVPPSDSKVRMLQLANRTSIERLSAMRKPVKVEPQAQALATAEVELNERSQVRVPDLRGRTVREVLRSLGGKPLEFEVIGSGTLKEQSPPAGQWLESGTKIRLVFEHADH